MTFLSLVLCGCGSTQETYTPPARNGEPSSVDIRGNSVRSDYKFGVTTDNSQVEKIKEAKNYDFALKIVEEPCGQVRDSSNKPVETIIGDVANQALMKTLSDHCDSRYKVHFYIGVNCVIDQKLSLSLPGKFKKIYYEYDGKKGVAETNQDGIAFFVVPATENAESSFAKLKASLTPDSITEFKANSFRQIHEKYCRNN